MSNTLPLHNPNLCEVIKNTEQLLVLREDESSVPEIHQNISYAWEEFVDERISPLIRKKQIPAAYIDDYKHLIRSDENDGSTNPISVLRTLFLCSEQVLSSHQTIAFAGQLAVLGNFVPTVNLGKDIRHTIRFMGQTVYSQLSFDRTLPFLGATWQTYERFIRLERLSRKFVPVKPAKDVFEDAYRIFVANFPLPNLRLLAPQVSGMHDFTNIDRHKNIDK